MNLPYIHFLLDGLLSGFAIYLLARIVEWRSLEDFIAQTRGASFMLGLSVALLLLRLVGYFRRFFRRFLQATRIEERIDRYFALDAENSPEDSWAEDDRFFMDKSSKCQRVYMFVESLSMLEAIEET